MCTVTFLSLNQNDFILTSSRDVPYARKKALRPKKYIEDSVEITYPKDGQAGGTWIGTSSKNRLICLLNGGFKNHAIKQSYRISRGLIVKELLKSDDITNKLTLIDLNNIEPFTLVIVDWNNDVALFEFVWTGEKKHLLNIPKTSHIWSSSTLYSQETRILRNLWFEEWLCNNKEFDQENILQFHKNAGEGNPKTDVLMSREKGGTLSITSFKKFGEKQTLIYDDILSKELTVL